VYVCNVYVCMYVSVYVCKHVRMYVCGYACVFMYVWMGMCVCSIPCAYWQRNEWSDCSKPCGGGTQTRTLDCRLPLDSIYAGRIVNASQCPSTQPTTTQTCNNEACTKLYWSYTAWSVCSAPCAGGTRQRTVTCMNSTSNLPATGCGGNSQNSSEACNTQACPVYEWFMIEGGNWTACSAFCGGATQTRVVECRDTVGNSIVSYEVVNDQFCNAAIKPISSRSCDTANGVCTPHGKCVAGMCQCNSSYSGQACNIAPAYSNVVTDATSFTAGVPAGEQITIAWTNTGDIPRVSLLLWHPTWHYPLYITTNPANTGSYLWTVPKGLRASSGYIVRAWFSPAVFADSAPFSIADPCFYTPCGVSGKCNSTGQCDCLNGFSGITCAASPCRYVCVCMYVCMHVCFCMYVCMYVCVCMYMYMYVYMCVADCSASQPTAHAIILSRLASAQMDGLTTIVQLLQGVRV